MTEMSLQRFDMNLPIGSVDAYIAYVNQVPLLTQEEEWALATRLQKQDDIDAAKPLILSHLRYVVKVARGYLGYGLPLNDLIQEGNIGLMKAVRRFNPDMGVRLVTFAVHWIKAEMHEYILRNWRIVKVATTKAQRKLFFNLRNMKKRLGWFTQEEINDVARDLGVDAATVVEMEMRMNASDTPFDADDDSDDENFRASPAGFLEDMRFSPVALLEKSSTTEQSNSALYQALEQLDERSQEILNARWLADDDHKATLQELADKYQVSAERIRQLEKSAMQKLRGLIEASIAA